MARLTFLVCKPCFHWGKPSGGKHLRMAPIPKVALPN